MRPVIFFPYLVSLLILSCAGRPILNADNRLKTQTHLYAHPYEKVFRACSAVLQTEGYAILEQDPTLGLLVAKVERSDRPGAIAQSLGGNSAADEIELSVQLEKVAPAEVRVRVSAQNLEKLRLGGIRGREFLESDFYDGFHRKLLAEIEGRRPTTATLSR